jgi:putative redox protein
MSGVPNIVRVTEGGRGPYVQAATTGRHALLADEPEANGGQDAGPSPYEYLLIGLGACTSVTMRMYAERHKWDIGRISVELWHEKVTTAGAPRPTDHFRRSIFVTGPLTPEQRLRLLQIAEHCPVSETLRHASVLDTVFSEQPQSVPPSAIA